MKILKKIDFILVFHFPWNYTELNMKESSQHYDCSLQLLLLHELSVSAVLAHTFWTLAEFTAFFSPCLSKKHKNFRASYFRLLSQLKGSWLFPNDTHPSHNPTVCLYNSPLSTFPLKYSLTIPSPTQCTSFTTYININKAHNFLQLASEISAMNCQGHPSIWNWDTAENVQCFSGTLPLIIDTSIPNIQRL